MGLGGDKGNVVTLISPNPSIHQIVFTVIVECKFVSTLLVISVQQGSGVLFSAAHHIQP